MPNRQPATSAENQRRLWPRVVNAVLFQLGWLACVLGGDAVAVGMLAAILFCHFGLVYRGEHEWRLIAIVGLLGVLCDSLLALAGVLVFDKPSLGLIPVWLACLWLIFATTLRHSLAWLERRLWLAALLGALAGPSSYIAGARLADVGFASQPLLSPLLLSLIWALLLPGLYWLSARLRP